ncbi:MAG: group 1 truncated hemoglobin [Terricaulis sp.]
MRKPLVALALSLACFALPANAQQHEEPVAPYEQSDANAGAQPITDPAVLEAFHGREGIERIANRTVDLALADEDLGPIFRPFDMVRLRRTLNEQFCYLLGGGCSYTGRDMRTAHANMGVDTRYFNRLVVHLRTAMREEGVPFAMQNRFLALLAPMHGDVVQ